jgi:arginine-tRNA-protein transferase
LACADRDAMAKLDDSSLPFSLLQFYATSPYACSYLPKRLARSQVATPTHLIGDAIYSELVANGFRRSGVFTYRPHCDDCSECVPVRVDVGAFTPNRTQKKLWNRLHDTTDDNRRLTAHERPLLFDQSHYDLYLRYQAARHAGGGMDKDNHEQYTHFLLQSRVDTRLIEFRQLGTLRCVSIIDVLSDGLSSVYTFFDPDLGRASFGTYAILWQIAQTKALKLPYLYLGYWIRDSRKMRYKTEFHPIEGLRNGQWQRLQGEASD